MHDVIVMLQFVIVAALSYLSYHVDMLRGIKTPFHKVVCSACVALLALTVAIALLSAPAAPMA